MPRNLLQQYFPMIRTHFEIQQIIRSNPKLNNTFMSWKPEQQKEFIDFCTGERGVKILYDSFFKEVFNAEYAPQRLEALLTLILKQPVKIIQVLPNDSTRLSDETSLLSTDVVVELADHSIANVEVQKIGYRFPGQRSACYSSDLLLRQYKRLRDERKKKFTYREIQKVYTIIFFEQSTQEFHAFPDEYLHYFRQTSNTGLKLDLLQEYYFIPLDIFHEIIQNKGINTTLDAWLTFLTSDDPETIIELLQAYPEFCEMYQDIYELCRNIEGVMNMFSKELLELDRNTVQLMIDEMQNEINQHKAELEETEIQLTQHRAQLTEQKAQITEQEAQITKQEAQITEQQVQLTEQQVQLTKQQVQLTEKDTQLQYLHQMKHLYSLLLNDQRLEDLGRAMSDETFGNELLKEYKLL